MNEPRRASWSRRTCSCSTTCSRTRPHAPPADPARGLRRRRARPRRGGARRGPVPARRVPAADPQQPGLGRELPRDVPDGGDPPRARHPVGGPGGDAEGRQHGRVRPRFALRRLGGPQFTLRFWIPDAAFGGGGAGLFESIETADTVELMGYLTGTTAFAARGNERAARFLAEGCAVESEHRAIARFAQTALDGRQQIQDRRRDDQSARGGGHRLRRARGGARRLLHHPGRPGRQRRRARQRGAQAGVASTGWSPPSTNGAAARPRSRAG